MVDRMSDSDSAPPGMAAKVAAESLGAALCDVAERLAGNMRDAASTLVDEQKDRAASLGYGLAEALNRAAAALAEEGNALVSRGAGEAALRLKGLSDAVRRQSWGEIAAGLDEAARRQPLLFCAGALAAGFIAGRLVAGNAGQRDREEA